MAQRQKDRHSYRRLLRLLKKRYGKVHDPMEQRQNLAGIRQQPEESLDDFAERVHRTASWGYKGMKEGLVQEMAAQAFLQGCREKLAALMAASHIRPKTVNKALKRLKASLTDQKAIYGRSLNLAARQVSFAQITDGGEVDVRNIQRNIPETRTSPVLPRGTAGSVPYSDMSTTHSLNPPPSLPRPRSDSPSRREFDQLKSLVDQMVPKMERLATSTTDRSRSRSPDRGGIRCFECRDSGHIARDCPRRNRSPSSSWNPDRGGARCFECRESGHLARDCPRRSRSPSRSPGGFQRNQCFYCKAEGHWARDCPEQRTELEQTRQTPIAPTKPSLNYQRVSSSAGTSPSDQD